MAPKAKKGAGFLGARLAELKDIASQRFNAQRSSVPQEAPEEAPQEAPQEAPPSSSDDQPYTFPYAGQDSIPTYTSSLTSDEEERMNHLDFTGSYIRINRMGGASYTLQKQGNDTYNLIDKRIDSRMTYGPFTIFFNKDSSGNVFVSQILASGYPQALEKFIKDTTNTPNDVVLFRNESLRNAMHAGSKKRVPASAAKKPASAAKKPASAAKKPASAAKKPASAAKKRI